MGRWDLQLQGRRLLQLDGIFAVGDAGFAGSGGGLGGSGGGLGLGLDSSVVALVGGSATPDDETRTSSLLVAAALGEARGQWQLGPLVVAIADGGITRPVRAAHLSTTNWPTPTALRRPLRGRGWRRAAPRPARDRQLDAGGDPTTRQLTGPDDYLAGYARFGVANTWQNAMMSPEGLSVTRVSAGFHPPSPVARASTLRPPSTTRAWLRACASPGLSRSPAGPVPPTSENAEQVLLFDQ